VNRFNLTFKGEILPDRDPEQVKARFGKLFAIDDHDRLERFFSGEPIILRRNLERKAAAEYYSKLHKLGVAAELVKIEPDRAAISHTAKLRQETENQKAQEEEARRKAEKEEQQRKAAEEAARQKALREEAQRLAAEETAKRKAELAEIKRRKDEEAAREKARLKAEREAQAKKQREEEAAAKRKAEQEAAERRVKQQEAARRAAEEAARRKAEKEEQRRKAAEEAAKRKVELAKLKRIEAEEAARQKALREEAKRQAAAEAAEEAARRKVEREEQRRKSAEESAKRKAQEQRKREEEQAQNKAREEEQAAQRKAMEEQAIQRAARELTQQSTLKTTRARVKSNLDLPRRQLDRGESSAPPLKKRQPGEPNLYKLHPFRSTPEIRERSELAHKRMRTGFTLAILGLAVLLILGGGYLSQPAARPLRHRHHQHRMASPGCFPPAGATLVPGGRCTTGLWYTHDG
jgi:hypothetical protein